MFRADVRGDGEATRATAAPKHEKVMPLKEADKNNDGYISRSEADASPALSKQFATLDKNGDGKLAARRSTRSTSEPLGGRPDPPPTGRPPIFTPAFRNIKSFGPANAGIIR